MKCRTNYPVFCQAGASLFIHLSIYLHQATWPISQHVALRAVRVLYSLHYLEVVPAPFTFKLYFSLFFPCFLATRWPPEIKLRGLDTHCKPCPQMLYFLYMLLQFDWQCEKYLFSCVCFYCWRRRSILLNGQCNMLNVLSNGTCLDFG